MGYKVSECPNKFTHQISSQRSGYFEIPVQSVEKHSVHGDYKNILKRIKIEQSDNGYKKYKIIFQISCK